MRDYIHTLLQEIKDDRTTGAAELVKKGVDAIGLFITDFDGDSSSFFNELIRISKILIDCQPTMAPFLNLANVLLLSAENRQDLEEMKESMKRAIRAFGFHIESAAERISKMARGLFQEGSRVLTHSYSSTVLRTLIDLKEEGKHFEVICTESRPMYEGCQLAKRLSESHIKVRLQIDSAAADTLKEVDFVLVGADCLTPLGLVNKVGTYGLALNAKEKGIPFYALCSTDKLLGEGMINKFRILKRDPGEVWPNAPEGVEVVNYYYDTTPLDYLRAIVTEEGGMSRIEIVRRFKSMRVSKYFPV